jgi:hypothetical protein
MGNRQRHSEANARRLTSIRSSLPNQGTRRHQAAVRCWMTVIDHKQWGGQHGRNFRGSIRALMCGSKSPMTSLTSPPAIRSPRRNYYMGRLPIPADHKVGGGRVERRAAGIRLAICAFAQGTGASASASRRCAISDMGRGRAVRRTTTASIADRRNRTVDPHEFVADARL